jgi:hypothetical protein
MTGQVVDVADGVANALRRAFGDHQLLATCHRVPPVLQDLE